MLGAGSRSWEQAKAAMGWGWGYDCSREAMGRSVHPHRARGWCSSCCSSGCICWDHGPPVPYAGGDRCGARSEVLPGRNGIGNRGWRCHQSWQVGFIDGHPDPKARRPGFQVSPSAVRGGPATNQGSLPPPAPQPQPFLPRSLGELEGPTGLKVCPCPTRRPFCNVSPCHKATGKLRPVPRHPLAPGACGAIEWIHGSCNKVGVAFFL